MGLKAHAILSASASHRWMACTPSARFEERYPDTGEASPYAQEGTKAHAVAESTLIRFLYPSDFSTSILPDNKEMSEAVAKYTDTVIEKVNEAKRVSKDAVVLIEKRLDFSEWVPEGFGTGDAVIISDTAIEICDLKYGKGVRVDAQGNSQMRLYALGAIHEYAMMYGFEKVRMTIIQPRLDHVDTEEMTVDDLLAWGEEVKKKASLAFKGKGDFLPGEHCRFCKGKVQCKAYKEYMTEEIKLDFTPNILAPKDLVTVLLKAKEIKAWITEVEDFALNEALQGRMWEGLKLVHGRSVRKITDPSSAIQRLTENGHTDIYKPQELKTITELEKLIGKKQFAEILGDVVEKPEGKPTLVALSDKRPAIDVNDIKSEFSDDL